MPPYSPLQPWLERRDPLRAFVDIDLKQPNQEFGGFIGLDISVPFHQAAGLPAQILGASWEETNIYVRKSLELIEIDKPSWLDQEEVRIILSELGPPPLPCYPIYIVSVGSESNEQPVYVGKTSAKIWRFQSGHHVATKLHDPRYDGLPKQIYLGCVMLLTDDKDYLPLEWVHPLAAAEELLTSVEAILIYNLKPELNIKNRRTCNPRFPVQLHIQNDSGNSSFLNDRFVSG